MADYFVNPWALWLAAGAGAPLLVHLLLRQRPKTVNFPLVRLIRRSQRQTNRRNRLRYIILLLMRMALIALFALIIARPSPQGKAKDIREGAAFGKETQAVVLVLDDSLSMRYRVGDVTLFETARQRALDVIRRLPADAVVGVLTTSPMSGKLVAELGTAGEQIKEMQPAASSSSCWGAMENAAELLRQDFASRSVLVFTDMTPAGWAGVEGRASDQLDMGEDVDVYVVDCATGIAGNGAIYEVYDEGAPGIVGGDLVIKARVLASAAPLERTVEFEFDGSPVARRNVKLESGEEKTLEFTETLRSPGHHWGRVSFLNPDGLAMDDARVFTVEVTPRVEVLIVEDDPTSQKDSPTYFLRRALCPWGEGKRGIFHVRRSSPARIPDLAKDAPDVVVLAATAQATDKLWGQLEAFVARGGGLLAFLGPEAGDAYRTDAAKALLGVEVGHPGAAPPQSPFRLRVVSQQNAIVQGLKGARADVGAMRFSQYHQVTPSPEAEEVLGFGRDRPALVLSRHGGKVAVFAGPPDERWGDFVTVSAYLPFCHETLLYLASRVATGISAHTVEDYVPIAYDAAGGKAVVALTRPGAQEAEELAQGDTPGQMAYGKTDVPGYYRLDFRRGGEKWRGGFAVNCAPAETHFDRVPFESVKAAIRARKVERLTDVSRLDFARYAGKSSMKEITPLIALMVLLLLCLEGFMANRFYKEPAVTPEPEEEASAKT